MPARIAFTASLIAALGVAAPGLATDVRDATPRDNAERSSGPGATEWWFTGVIDPVTGEAFAASLGTRMASGPSATAVLSLPPGGGERTLGHLRLGAEASRSRVDVRMGPDSLREVRPGVYRLKVRGRSGFALHGRPSDVSADLVIRRTAPGFVAGPMRLGNGQYVGWTVAAPRATATGTFRVGGRTVRVKDAPAYHDHNWGRFSLSGGRLAGWDWSQAFLPGGRALRGRGEGREWPPRRRGRAVRARTQARHGPIRGPRHRLPRVEACRRVRLPANHAPARHAGSLAGGSHLHREAGHAAAVRPARGQRAGGSAGARERHARERALGERC